MNEFVKFAEKKLTVLALLFLTGVMDIGSYYNASEGVSPVAVAYVTSPTERFIRLYLTAFTWFALFLLAARWKSAVRPITRDPFLWGLLGLAVLSYFWSDLPYMSKDGGTKVLQTTLLGLYIASRYTLKEQLRMFAWALGIAAVFSLFFTLAFRGAGIESGLHSGAWRGPLIHKNLFARLSVVLALAPLLVAPTIRKYSYIVWAIFAISGSFVILTTSKTALLIFLTLLILFPLYSALRLNDTLIVPLLITVVLVVGSAGTFLASNWEPFLYGIGRDPTLNGRTDIWDAVIYKITSVLGWGMAFKPSGKNKGKLILFGAKLDTEFITLTMALST